MEIKRQTKSKEIKGLTIDLGQQSLIGWEPQIILGVPIFSQQTHLKN